MKQALYIPKNRSLHPSEDFHALRKEGIEHIEKLSHRIWTDYNIHDPGITILEALCYAITDIAYRTSFDIKDILAWRKDGQPVRKNFFTAREILTCNPVTEEDFRKLLIDIEGVRNAWLSLVKDYTPEVFADCDKSLLTTSGGKKSLKKLELKGLYDIILELDDIPGTGDLNDYSFLYIFNRNKLEISLPTWEYYFSEQIDPASFTSIIFSYAGYVQLEKLHIIDVSISSGSDVLSLKATVASLPVVPEETVKKFIDKLNAEKEEFLLLYKRRLVKAVAIAGEVFSRLHTRRNLCEDYRHITGVKVEEVGLCADIELEADVDPETVYAEIMYRVSTHLAPPVTFYTLEEMLEKGMRATDIFQGPALDHGFLDQDELERSELKKVVHVSDLVRIIMDIPGVLAIKKILLSSFFKGKVLFPGEEWSLPVSPGRAARLNFDRSKLTFYKNIVPYYADKVQAEDILNKKFLSGRKQKLGASEHDIPVPEGKYQDISSYSSIQNEFPLTYGIGKRGIPGLVDGERRAKAKQLKGFLLLFDQILASYLAQLAHLRDLFSFQGDETQTFFNQLLYSLPDGVATPLDGVTEEVPEIYKLINEFIDAVPDSRVEDFKSYKAQWEAFKSDLSNGFVQKLQQITEPEEVFLTRRNRFLDHLMARFAEQFTDYVLLMYKLDKKKAPKELIEDKVAFLKDYPGISHDRGKAFDYTLEGNTWDTENVSGLEKRLTRLSGIDSFERRFLRCEEPDIESNIYKDTAGEWRFNLKSEEGDILLTSEGYTTRQNAGKGLKSVYLNGVDRTRYKLMRSSGDHFYYNLVARNGEIIGTSPMFGSAAEREEALQELITLLTGECGDEGFHLVEHILLRPKTGSDPLMEVCIEPGCNSCLGNLDPYSFRITIVLPAWPERFRNMDFRRYFEHLARLEAPAHIHVKICWVDNEDMLKFENSYKDWLEINALKQPDETERKDRLNKLLQALKEIRSVYPVATLHDCDESQDENPVLLGHTILGSSKNIKK